MFLKFWMEPHRLTSPHSQSFFQLSDMRALSILSILCFLWSRVSAKTPKIYVYDNKEVDWSYLTKCYEDAHDGLSPEMDEDGEHAQNMGEVWMHRAMLSHPNRVYYPEEANMFYVPLYITVSSDAGPMAGSLSCDDKTHYERMEDALNYLEFKSTYFKRLGGADHFFTCTWWRCGPAMGNRARVVLSRTVLAINESPPAQNDWARWECMDRVVTVPYVASSKLTSTGVDHHSNTKRSIPFYFAGRSRGREERENLSIIQESIPGSSIGVTAWSWTDGPNSYADHITNSKFCLCPRGDTQSSRRLYDAIAAGCIPIMTESQVEEGSVPYNNHLAYDSFSFVYEDSVFLNKTMLLEKAMILNSIPDEHLVSKRRHLAFAHKVLVYSNETTVSQDSTPSVMMKYFMREVYRAMFAHGTWGCDPTPWWERPAEWVSVIPPPVHQVQDWSTNTESIVIREHEIFMCTPPFSGSKPIRLFLKKVQEMSSWKGGNIIDGLDIVRLDGSEMYDIFARVGWIKAAMVRDPVTRILTAYVASVSRDPTRFKEFIGDIYEKHVGAIPEMFRPMRSMCGLRHVHFESIIPYENVATDGKMFLRSLPKSIWETSGMNWGDSGDMDVFEFVDESHSDDSVFGIFDTCEWVEYFDGDIFSMMEIIYKEDYQAFGWYDIETWRSKYEECM